MSEVQQPSPQNENLLENETAKEQSMDSIDNKNTLRIATIIFFAAIAVASFYFFLAWQLGAWQMYALASVIAVFVASSFYAMRQIQKGDQNKGIWIIIVGMYIVFPVAVALIAEIGLIFAGTVLLLTYIVSSPTLPTKQNRRALFYGALVAIFTGVLGQLNLTYRLVVPEIKTFVPGITAVIFAVIGYFIARQAWAGFNVRAKLISSISVVSMILIGVLTVFSVRNSFQQAETEELKQLTATYENYNTYVGSLEDTAAALAISLADRSDVQELHQSRDRQGLLNLLTPVFNTLETDYNIAHMYIENTDGTVFLRIHDPESFGEDASYQHIVKAALDFQEPVAGVEIGSGHLGVRGVAPIFDGKQFTGMVEVGIDYDQAFINNLKASTNSNYNLLITQEAATPAGLQPSENFPDAPAPGIFYYASTYQDPVILPVAEDVYKRVLETGTPETHYANVDKQELVVLIAPLLGYEDHTIGIIEIISSREEILSGIRRSLLNSLGIAALVSIVGFASLLLVTQFIILRPIEQLTQTSRQQLAGDLIIRVPKLANDEFGELGETLNTLTEKLQGGLAELEERVAERTAELERSSEQVQRRAKQFESIAQVSRIISSIKNQEELLTRITRMISQYFEFYHVGVFLLDDEKQYAVLRAANSEGGQRMLQRGHRLEVGQTGIVGYVTSTGNPRVALDTGADAVYFNNPDLPNTHSEMALPLKVGGQVVGALDVQSTQPNAFSQEDVNILSALADQVSATLENARLHEEAQEALSKAEVAYRQLTGKAWANIHRFAPVVGYRFDGTKAEPLNTPTNGKQAEGRDEAFSVPVQLRGESIGQMRIKPTSGHQWTEDEIAIFQATAERVALAVENARLVSESQKRASKEQVIGEASSKISSAINLDNILQTALREMGRILPGAEISIQVENE